MKKALVAGAQGERVAHRQGHDRRGLQGDGFAQASVRRARSVATKLKILDHLEEWLIAFLIGAATLLIFVAVAAPLRRRRSDPGRAGRAAQDRPVVGAGALHLHVRVDGEVRRRLRRAHRHPRRRRRHDQPAAAATRDGSTCCSACSPARSSPASSARWAPTFVWDIAHTDSVSPDLEVPKWIVYLCIPLGSYLMCFRFLQVAWSFLRTGELPHHDVAHVEGIEAEDLNLRRCRTSPGRCQPGRPVMSAAAPGCRLPDRAGRRCCRSSSSGCPWGSSSRASKSRTPGSSSRSCSASCSPACRSRSRSASRCSPTSSR